MCLTCQANKLKTRVYKPTHTSHRPTCKKSKLMWKERIISAWKRSYAESLTCNSLTSFSVIILESGVVEPPPAPPFPPPPWLLLTPVLFGVLFRPPPAPGGVGTPVAVAGVPPPPPPPPPPVGGCPKLGPGGIDGGPLACCQKSGFILKTDLTDCCCTSADMEEASGIGVARRSKGVV